MEVMDRTEKRKSIVDLINPLIEQAFGKGFKGNYDHEFLSILDGPDGMKEVNGLRLIGRKKFLGLLYEYAGQLGSKLEPEENDGSVIAVFPKYEPTARKYAKLYKQKTGKDVTIILTDAINPADKKVLSVDKS